MRKTRFYTLLLLALGLLLVAGLARAQEEGDRLRVLDVDAAGFPTVRVTVLASDSVGAPLADLSALLLRENGNPIADISYANVPNGVDITFVLDANVGYEEVDDDAGLARADKVRESISRFARFYMDSEGRDRVSIVVPDETYLNGRFLLQGATRPQEVLDAIAAYDPGPLRPTPLNTMLNLGLEDLGQRALDEPNRYRAMLLFSDSRRLDEQLSYPLLTAQANDSESAIHVAILGAQADAQEIDNARRLYEPTRAGYVHMPQPEDTDPLYGNWQELGNPPQLIFRSPQRESGQNQIALALGPAQASAAYEVQLAAPQLVVQPAEVQVRRTGAAPDTPLADLQPAVWPFVLEVQWPDDLPRRLTSVRLLVDGREQPLELTLPDLPATTIPLSWDMGAQDEGAAELVFEATDELGFTGTVTVPVTISVQRPAVSTAVPTAALAPDADQIAVPLNLPALRREYLAAPLALLVLLLLGLVWRARRRRRRARALQAPLEGQAVLDAGQGIEAAPVLLPWLEPAAAPVIALPGETNTIGRSAASAQVVLSDKSVSPLHARIRHRDESTWLLDEGSAEGTFLNYQRLGLAPAELRDGDVVQFGALTYTFRLRTQAEVDALVAHRAPIAVIFDMDGLMVDTEPLSRQAWDIVLGEEGLMPLQDEQYNGLVGRRLQETAEFLVATFGLSVDPLVLAERKNEAFASVYAAEIPIMPGLHDLIAELARRQVPWGVATSTPRAVAEDILARIGVAEACAALAAGDEVPNGKPAPDVYLLTAARLEVAPARCLALEDTELGCQAAHAAGMLTIAVPGAVDGPESFSCATAVLPSLVDFLPQVEQRLSELRQR